MKLRSLTLGTAALAGTLLLAGSSFAEPSVYNTNPTPAERAATQQLNDTAADRARDDTTTNDAAHDNYNAARSDYDRNLQNYDAQRAAYERDRARYDREHGGYAHRWDAFYGFDHFRDVTAMPSRDLVGLSVSTRGGDHVGRIRDVDSNRDGRITRVAVGIRGGDTAWIDADDLRYDPNTRAVFTDLTRDQVDSMSHMRYPRF